MQSSALEGKLEHEQLILALYSSILYLYNNFCPECINVRKL